MTTEGHVLNWSHQRGLFDPAHARPVTVIGVGSVGSEVALQLAKMGARDITLVDNDSVDSHNVPMSLVFGLRDVARFKVDVVAERLRHLAGVEAKMRREMYTGGKLRGSIVCCVDSMDVRQLIWKAVKDNPAIDILIDTRIHEYNLHVYAIRPCDDAHTKLYELRLYSTKEARMATCGNHGVAPVTSITASLAVRALTNVWSGGTPTAHEHILLGTNGTHLWKEGEQDGNGTSRIDD